MVTALTPPTESCDYALDAAPVWAQISSPTRIAVMVAGAALFVGGGVVLLRAEPNDLGAVIAAWCAIVFFGGGALLALVAMALAPHLKSIVGQVAFVRVDRTGITWTSGNTRFGGPALRVTSATLPWCEIASFTLVDAASLRLRSAGSTSSLPAWSRIEPLDLQIAGVVPRDGGASFLAAMPPIKATIFRYYLSHAGAFPVGPSSTFSAAEMIERLESSRAGFAPANP